MTLRIIFLGTTGSIPTKSRGMPSIAIRRESDLLLFDCGEGTQRQMLLAHLSPLKVGAIFITHLHGDHFLGLAGLIQTMSLFSRKEPLSIYCPRGEGERLKSYIFAPRYDLTFDLEICELSDGEEVRMSEYRVVAAEADHSVPSLAYALVENDRPGRLNVEKAISLGVRPGPDFSRLKAGESITLPDGRKVYPSDVLGPARRGRKIVYTGDTIPSEKIVKLSKDADVLIHDCTLGEEFSEKAREGGHSTPLEAAEIARAANVRLLILFHISPRHEDPSPLLEQARRIFPNTIIAEDLMELEIPYPEE
ncbi:MAG: ribonuclease Z [Candidatus Hadarchaeales archaeon]